MFGWLADLLVKSSVVGSSCSCCSAQNERLKKMQKAVLEGNPDIEESACTCQDCGCRHEEPFEMTTTYHYKL